jgi:hypothetical protein
MILQMQVKIRSMNDRITVKISMEPHLKAFLLSFYHQKEPIFFPKKDKLNDLLQLLLSKPPRNHCPRAQECGCLEIILPYYENLNIMSYHYLSPECQRIFCIRVKKIFWYTFEDFMDDCHLQGMYKKDSIWLFMEKYNIPVELDIEDRLKKELYRSKLLFRKYAKREYCKKKL